MPQYSDESKRNLERCHPDLQRVFNKLIEFFDVKITCGHRTKEEQDRAVESGASYAKWPESRHNRMRRDDGTWDNERSDAVDAVPWPVQWPDMKTQTTLEYVRRIGRFYFMAGAVLAIAHMYGVKLRWGGHFKRFFDGPHFERVCDE